MSLLNPGGSRQGWGRIFGFNNIRRAIQQRGKSYEDRGSVAQGNRWGGPHLHRREINRNLRRKGLS